MSRVDSLSSLPAACAVAGTAACTWFAVAAEVAMQIFGVPLPVLLASLTGALGARVFLPQQPFWRALFVSVFWTFAGAFGAQLVLWLASAWLEKPPPPGVLAGVALLAAALGQRVAPILWNKGGEALERRLDGLFRKEGK